MGEAAGLFPNPDFSPLAYLRHNSDVAEEGVRPFEHYLLGGRHEARITREPNTDVVEDGGLVAPLRGQSSVRANIAVVVHIYYPDLWEEFRARLAAQHFDFDLYVTLTNRGPESQKVKEKIEADWPSAHVLLLPNRGRDIYPFLHLLNAGWLDSYQAVCKFHTKKSPHRSDGDIWRNHLIDGILPTGSGPDTEEALDTETLLSRFLSDEDAVIWVADGQHYNGAEWWGSNFAACQRMLTAIEILPNPKELDFPAGSIYWIKPQVLAMLKALNLGPQHFDPEQGQTDGTIAHVLERAIGVLCAAGGWHIRQTSDLQAATTPTDPAPRPAFVSAFYLPQFHPTAENDSWWGKGYTEWTATSRARPQFSGHDHPVLPADLGFYDLRLTEVLGEQAALAKDAGIDAFCVYHYWFDGQRLLEAPIDQLLTRPEIDFPFYLCWANESWRRNWDGLSGEVLMPQSYAPGFARELATSLVPYFNDPRYQRPDGTRPRFVIYRPEDMADPAAAVAEMRTTWRELGIGEVELGAVRFHVAGDTPVDEALFDFWIEMPPHGLVTEDEDILFGGRLGNRMRQVVPPEFQGLVYDYDRVRLRSQASDYVAGLPRQTIAGIMPRWDNTARRGTSAHVAWGANPARFERWLSDLRRNRIAGSYRQEIMINAWNEWAEKAVLEPDQRYGHGFLAALRRATNPSQDR